MKILFITPFFYPHKGGGELYAEELLSTLVRKHPEVEVDVLCYNTERATPYERRFGLNIHRVKCFNVPVDPFALPRPLSLIKKLSALRRRNYRFVFTQTRFFDSTWWSWLYAKLIGAKSVFIGHGTDFVTHPNWLVRWTARLVDLTLARVSLKLYDRVVVISQATKTFYQRYLGVRKALLIYGGIDLGKVVRSRRGTSRTVVGVNKPIPKGATLVTYVGRLTWAKGVTFLYEAFKEVLSQEPDRALYLVIAGGGPLKESLREQTESDGLAAKVFLSGSLDLDQVFELLSMSNVFINPSHNEGLPRTVMEAAAAGCLVIATAVGATGEIIQDKRSGLLIPPRSTSTIVSALKWVLNYPPAARLMAQRAQKDVQKKFDWEAISERFYAQVLAAEAVA